MKSFTLTVLKGKTLLTCHSIICTHFAREKKNTALDLFAYVLWQDEYAEDNVSAKLNEEFILIFTDTLQRETEKCELSLLLLKVLPAIPAIPC